MTAIQHAKADGLRFFWYTLHVGGAGQFVADSWADAGFRIDRHGDPVTDYRGNTVTNAKVEELDENNPEHVRQCEEWYQGF